MTTHKISQEDFDHLRDHAPGGFALIQYKPDGSIHTVSSVSGASVRWIIKK